MTISLVLTLLVTAGGTIATYLYDEGASLAARLCSGACLGLTALGLIGFVCASFLGLNPISIVLATVLVLVVPLLVLKKRERRKTIASNFRATLHRIGQTIKHPNRLSIGYSLFYLVIAIILWRVFDRAMIELPNGISTGVLNNFGDLPFHLSVITGFAYGNNFPPEDPTYAGVRFTYPFLTDFISAIFVVAALTYANRCSLRISSWRFRLLGSFIAGPGSLEDRLAAVLTPLLVLLSGGLGWVCCDRSESQRVRTSRRFKESSRFIHCYS